MNFIEQAGSFAEHNKLELNSFSQDESIDGIANDNQNMTGRYSSSEIGKADDSFDEPSSDHRFDDWQGVSGDSIVECLPDYIVYRDKYSTDSVVTFSSSCIKVEGYGQAETFVFQWGVDHIINIESQWCERSELAMVKIRVISEGTTPTEDIHGNTGIEEFKFAIVEEGWYEKQDEIMSLDVYKPLWKIVLNSDMDAKALPGQSNIFSSKHYFPSFEDSFEDVIYPKGDPDAVSISKRDVDLLQPDTFVNDTIIDFYIKYLKNKIDPRERHRFHFFNSFFFRKLADLDKNPSSAIEGRAAFLRVRKWTRKINLFEKDYVFVPVNFNYHWSLIVICHLGEVADFQDTDASKSLKLPCILHMDSIRGSHSNLKGLLQSYLWEEWKERQTDTSEDISSRFSNLRFLSLELPQQQNLYDCGLFLLHYVELFLEGNLVNINPFKISSFSNFLTACWFQPAEASLKRAYIERLIYDILDNRSCETSPSVGGDKNCTSKYPIYADENGSTLEFLSDRSSPSKVFHESEPSSQAGPGLELTLLQTSVVKDSQRVNDSGSVLREPAEAEAALESFCQAFEHTAPSEEFKNAMQPMEDSQRVNDTGSVLREPAEAEAALESFCQAFEHTAPSEEFKNAMQPMEEKNESCKHFHCSSSVATGLQQPTTITTEASDAFLSKESGEEPLLNPGSSIRQNVHMDMDIGPFKESICASNDSFKSEDANNNKIGTNLTMKVQLGHHQPRLQDNLDLFVDLRVHLFSDHMLNGNENACSKNPRSPPQDCDALENRSATCEPMQSMYDASVSEQCEQQATKKRRLTPVEEEGELPESSDGDLHA